MVQAVLGIIGGSGLYDLPGFEDSEWVTMKSPWGQPSDDLRIGELHGHKLFFYLAMAVVMSMRHLISIIEPTSMR